MLFRPLIQDHNKEPSSRPPFTLLQESQQNIRLYFTPSCKASVIRSIVICCCFSQPQDTSAILPELRTQEDTTMGSEGLFGQQSSGTTNILRCSKRDIYIPTLAHPSCAETQPMIQEDQRLVGTHLLKPGGQKSKAGQQDLKGKQQMKAIHSTTSRRRGSPLPFCSRI